MAVAAAASPSLILLAFDLHKFKSRNDFIVWIMARQEYSPALVRYHCILLRFIILPFPAESVHKNQWLCKISWLNISFQVYRIAATSISFAKTTMPGAYYSAVSRSSQGVWVPSLFLPLVSSSGASDCLDTGWNQAGRLRHTNTEPILTSVSASSQPKFRNDNKLRQIQKSTQPLTI